MIRAVIIEDEKKAADYLATVLKEVESSIAIDAVLSSVDSGIRYFSGGEKVDIIFSDVQLSDGLSFSIFAAVKPTAPVVFITGYDRFMLDAFENNGIDYLLKPVSKDDLEKAIRKYKGLEKHFVHDKEDAAFHHLMHYVATRKRSRILVRRRLYSFTRKTKWYMPWTGMAANTW
jgi:two-component SAPR family response regulator